MDEIPQAAIKAAAEALLRAWNANDDEPERFEAHHSATVALQVAAPLIAAAERERITGMADRLAATVPVREGTMPFSTVIREASDG